MPVYGSFHDDTNLDSNCVGSSRSHSPGRRGGLPLLRTFKFSATDHLPIPISLVTFLITQLETWFPWNGASVFLVTLLLWEAFLDTLYIGSLVSICSNSCVFSHGNTVDTNNLHLFWVSLSYTNNSLKTGTVSIWFPIVLAMLNVIQHPVGKHHRKYLLSN